MHAVALLAAFFAISTSATPVTFIKSEKPSPSRTPKRVAVSDIFAWDSIADHTGVRPADYIPDPAIGGEPEMYACTKKPGPDPIKCSNAIAAWAAMADDNLKVHIPGGECRSVTADCCQAVVCAPHGDVDIDVDEATGRMWNPVAIKCVNGGYGGLWRNKGGSLFVEMESSLENQCKTSTG